MNELSKSSISVFFPAFNDASTIGSLVTEALKMLPTLTNDYEVIVVNDGSTDETAIVLDKLARAHPRLRIVHHARNQGYGGALRSGFKAASKNLVFYTDGDGQYDVRELLKLYSFLTNGVDIVNGYKLKRADPKYRQVLGAVYNRFARFLFRLPVRDVDCDCRLIRRQAMEKVKLTASSGVICVELVFKLRRSGCVFAEAPVNHYPRTHGRSQFFTPRRIIRSAFDLLSLWFRLSVLRRPA